MAITLTSKIGFNNINSFLSAVTLNRESKFFFNSLHNSPLNRFLPFKRINFPFNSSCTHFATNIPTMSKTALVLIVDGSEEMEFTITADVLRRAGVAVTVAGVEGGGPVKCSREIVIVPDLSLTDAVKKGPYDAVILPGGVGYKRFAASAEVGSLLREQEKEGRLIAAICAAPSVLKTHGIGTGKTLTSYPTVKEELVNDYKYLEDKVVIDGNLTTSRGPGTAFDFALALAEQLTNKENVESVKTAMLM